MSYREKTPQIVSVLTRKLKKGKTFEDFQKAHLPPGEVEESSYGYDVDYFNGPARVINCVSTKDPSLILSIGLVYGSPEEVFTEIQNKMPLEKGRHEKISQVADKVGEAEVYFTASDNNYGGKDPEHEQLPLYEVTEEVVEAMHALFASKKEDK